MGEAPAPPPRSIDSQRRASLEEEEAPAAPPRSSTASMEEEAPAPPPRRADSTKSVAAGSASNLSAATNNPFESSLRAAATTNPFESTAATAEEEQQSAPPSAHAPPGAEDNPPQASPPSPTPLEAAAAHDDNVMVRSESEQHAFVVPFDSTTSPTQLSSFEENSEVVNDTYRMMTPGNGSEGGDSFSQQPIIRRSASNRHAFSVPFDNKMSTTDAPTKLPSFQENDEVMNNTNQRTMLDNDGNGSSISQPTHSTQPPPQPQPPQQQQGSRKRTSYQNAIISGGPPAADDDRVYQNAAVAGAAPAAPPRVDMSAQAAYTQPTGGAPAPPPSDAQVYQNAGIAGKSYLTVGGADEPAPPPRVDMFAQAEYNQPAKRCSKCNAKMQFCMCNTNRSGTLGKKSKSGGSVGTALKASGVSSKSRARAQSGGSVGGGDVGRGGEGGRGPIVVPQGNHMVIQAVADGAAAAAAVGTADSLAADVVAAPVQRVDLFAASAVLDVFGGAPVEFVPVSNPNDDDGEDEALNNDGGVNNGAPAPMPAGFKMSEKTRNPNQPPTLPPRSKKQTVGKRIGNWFGLGDPYGRLDPPKLAAKNKGKKWLAQAKAAEAAETAAAAEAEAVATADLEAALDSMTSIQETSFDDDTGKKQKKRRQKQKQPLPPPPAGSNGRGRRIQPKKYHRKPHGVANTLRAARHRMAQGVGLAKREVSLEGKEGTSIKDHHLAVQAYDAFVRKEKTHQRSVGYATTKMNQKYTLRNRAAGRLDNPSGGPGSMNTWALAQSSTVSTMHFSKETRLQENEEERLQEELMSLPEFTPYFTYTLTVVHSIVLLVMMMLSLHTGDFGKIGIFENEIVCSVENLAECPFGFDGKVNLNATRIDPVNPWIGPSQDFLIRFNARLTTCMRTDTTIQAGLALQREQECGTLNSCDTGNPDDGFSCCRHFATDNLGMMSKAACQAARGEWVQQAVAGRLDPQSVLCSEVEEGRVALRPCCQGHKSQCSLTTKTECAFADGVWHIDKELCSEVACLEGVCGSWKAVTQNAAALNELEQPNQGWRFVWPLFMHSGVIHYVLVMFPQYYLGTTIEISVGWLRIMLIYFISGIGGYMTSGLFDPYEITCGANPALFGLIAVGMVELLVSWKVVETPWWELLKQLLIIAFAFMLGTLPFIDNWSHLGGFVCGALAAVIFLPYVAFGKWAQRGRIIALIVSVPLLLILMLFLSIMFNNVGDTSWCPDCYKFSCIKWHSSIACQVDTAAIATSTNGGVSPYRATPFFTDGIEEGPYLDDGSGSGLV